MAKDSDVPVDLYIAAYDDADAAQEDFDALKELVKDGVIFMDVAVLVSRDAEGKLTVKENAHEVAKGGMVGALGGLVLGLIFPAGVIAATVVGGAAGAGIGGLMSHHREHEIKKEIEDVLPPDSSGIIAIFDEVWVEQVEKALAKAEKVDKEKIDKESVEKAKEAASKAS
jgi:uncharacterized membrane protein